LQGFAGEKKKENPKEPESSSEISIEKHLIEDFDGIEEEGNEGRKAFIKYVYYTLIEDIDSAMKTTREISRLKKYLCL